MPDIEYAFLADAAETAPGQKFHVLGGGITQINGRTFPLRHPHLALVVGLRITAVETGREHELRFVLLDPDGHEIAEATGSLVAGVRPDARDETLTFSVDLWNLTFPAAGDYSFRVLVNGSERRRLPLIVAIPADAGQGPPGPPGSAGPGLSGPGSSGPGSSGPPSGPQGPSSGSPGERRYDA